VVAAGTDGENDEIIGSLDLDRPLLPDPRPGSSGS
jgi:hypothetical protein